MRTLRGGYSPEITGQFEALGRAARAQTVDVMGKEQVKTEAGTNLVLELFLELCLWIWQNSRTKMADLNGSAERLVEGGLVKEI